MKSVIVSFRFAYLLFVSVICLLSAACMQQQDESPAETQASSLLYEEQEAGTASYPVRIMVNADHVRLDDGYDGSDYALMERKSRTIYSVSHEEKRILVIDTQVVEHRQPADLNITVEQEHDAGSPMIAGIQPLHVSIKANDEVCFQAVVVPGLLPTAIAGLIEYAQALGTRQLAALDTVPESVQTPCYLTRYAYAPELHLRHGLPIQEWDTRGFRRKLVDYNEQESVAPALFLLPSGYERIRIDAAATPVVME